MPLTDAETSNNIDTNLEQQKFYKKIYELIIKEVSSTLSLSEISTAIQNKIEELLSKVSVERFKNKTHFETVVLKEIDQFEIRNPRIEGIFNVRAEMRKSGKEAVRENHEKQKRAIAETKRLIEEAIFKDNSHPFYLKKIVREMAVRYGFTQEQVGNMLDLINNFEKSKSYRKKIFKLMDEKAIFKLVTDQEISNWPGTKVVNGPYGIEIYANKDCINFIANEIANQHNSDRNPKGNVEGFQYELPFYTFFQGAIGVQILFSQEERKDYTAHERQHSIFKLIYPTDFENKFGVDEEFKKLTSILESLCKEIPRNNEKINFAIKNYFMFKNKFLRRKVADEMLSTIKDKQDLVDESNPNRKVQNILTDKFFLFIDFGGEINHYSFFDREMQDKQQVSMLPNGISENVLFDELGIDKEQVYKIKSEVFMMKNAGLVLRVGLAIQKYLKVFPDDSSRNELINNLSLTDLPNWENTIKKLIIHKLNNRNK